MQTQPNPTPQIVGLPDGTLVYALFEGRHELPPHNGALYSPETSGPFGLVRTPAFDEALAAFKSGSHVAIIVTGLTAAMLDLVAEFAKAARPLIESGYTVEAAPDWSWEYLSGDVLVKYPQGVLYALHHDRESGQYLPQKLI